MLRFLLIFCSIGICVSGGGPHALSDSCKEFFGHPYVIPNCADAGQCFEQSHKKAKECVDLEKKDWEEDPKKKACYEENKNLFGEWFGASCDWHLAIMQCMNNDPAPTGVGAGNANEVVADLELEDKYTKHKACWEETDRQIKECTQQAEDKCTNYKFCNGNEDAPSGDDRLSGWSAAVRAYANLKRKKMNDIHEKMKDCIGQ